MIIVLVVIAVELLFISIHLISIDNLIEGSIKGLSNMIAHVLDKESKIKSGDKE